MALWMGMLDLLLKLPDFHRLESGDQCFDIQYLVVVHHFHKR